MTRERVRRIESWSVTRFMNHRTEAKKIFAFLHALTGSNFFLTLNDLKNFLDVADANIFWFFVAKTNLAGNAFYFNDELNAVVFAEEAAFDEKTYSEKIFHRDRLTLTFECSYVLKKRFPNGYRIGDENFYSRFMRYLKEIFNERTPLTQRKVDAKIEAIGFLCDREKYIHPDLVHLSAEIIEHVKNFIEASDHIAIPYKEIFTRLKNIFIGTQITNRYFLQGAIKFFNLPYTLRKDYLTKSDEIDMVKEFDGFVAERGEVSVQDIKENFISLTEFNIKCLISRCPKILRVAENKFMHASRLNLRNDEFETMKKFLHQNCSTPVNARVLLNFCVRSSKGSPTITPLSFE